MIHREDRGEGRLETYRRERERKREVIGEKRRTRGTRRGMMVSIL